ncbi:signal peptidase II [Fusibacter paucivorans]|uniref:Lipoprotein signal peptidase n=1 Tax=Fusibacter paucivorans TaxID=76009 RepID=A0ABS5PQ12_9FIRM|nr:signal peptidase II [Fusibacter paucivorans]MBS7527263.1 signal peptidase II [Fusibacter paucivorans]
MLYFALTCVLIVLDQWMKAWAIDNLMGQPIRTLIPGILGLRYIENTGAAFSILSGKQLVLILITFIILGAIFGLFIRAVKNHEHFIVQLSYSLIMAGAIGNFIDRVRFNYVVDFFEFKFINFPIFNVADVAIVSGVILLAIATLFLDYNL